MRTMTTALLAGVVVWVLAACSTTAPPYPASIDNAEAGKRLAQPLAVGAFELKPGLSGGSSISLRGNSMASPVGADFAAYLAHALRQELNLAGRLDEKSAFEVSGVLMKNDLDAAIGESSGEVEARFVLRQSGQVRFDKLKRARLAWPGSFAGAVAIPGAINQYPVLVQKLIGELLADPEFAAALR